MRRISSLVGVLCGTALVSALPTGRLNAAVPELYSITKSIPMGAPDRWDYLVYDSASHRVYVAHESEIAVINGQSGESLGRVSVPGANGVAVVPAAGKGYAGSRASKSVLVFDLEHFSVTKTIPAGEDTDGVLFDPASKRVFVMQGDPKNLLVIDTGSDSVAATIALDGKPEYSAVDGRGKLYVNIADKREIQRIDTRKLKVDATWPIPACESPHGLSIDVQNNQLFASCVNSKLMVVDALSGRVTAELPIGFGTDATAVDTTRHRAFSSNWDGTLSVIDISAAGHAVSLGEVPTQPQARTMAIDSASGRVYLVAADRIEVDPAATNPKKRYGTKPGSVRLLFVDPTR
jgi:DNA-binding beta-propeller fold protein YncE